MNDFPILVSVVIPVFKGEFTLEKLINEILPLIHPQELNHNYIFQVSEIILVHDCGPDNSDLIIKKLVDTYDFINAVWLTKILANTLQH